MRKTIGIIALLVFVVGAVVGGIFFAKSTPTQMIYVKTDGLYLRNARVNGEPVCLAEGNGISLPALSSNGKYAAYIQEGKLVLHTVKSGEGIVIAENPQSFLFDDQNRLVVADEAGTVFRVRANGSQTPVYGTAFYRDLVLAPDGTLYAHAYEKQNRGSQVVLRPTGIVCETKEGFTMVLEGRKQVPSERDLGFAPKIAAFSKQGDEAYIFHCPQSVALSADGVPIGVLNLSTGTYTPPVDTEQVVIPERSMATGTEVSGEVAVTLGFGRNLNKQKRVGILRPSDGSFRPVSAEGQIGWMAQVSDSGEKMTWVQGTEDMDLESFMNLPKAVCEMDLKSGETRVVSKETTVYLAPFYAENDEAVIALRRETDGNFVLVRMDAETETVLDSGICFDGSGVQNGQIPVNHFFSRNG